MTRLLWLSDEARIHWLRSLLCGVWLACFTWPLLSGARLLSPVQWAELIVTLVLINGLLPSVHRVWVSAVSLILWLDAWQNHRLPWVGLPPLVTRWAHQFVQVQHGDMIPVDLAQVFAATGLALLYGLLTYACIRRNLWLFYNALGACVWVLLDIAGRAQPGLFVPGFLATGLLLFAVSEWDLLVWQGLMASQGLRGHPTASSLPLGRLALLALCIALGCFTASAVVPRVPIHLAPPAAWLKPGAPEVTPSVSVTGYTSDIHHLGGSIVSNNVPVMSVIAPYATYLRGESYDTYTGKGWINQLSLTEPIESGQRLPPTADLFGSTLTVRRSTMTVTTLQPPTSDVLFGGYSIQQITLLGKSGNGQLVYRPGDSSIHSNQMQGQTEYRVTSETLVQPERYLDTAPPLSISADRQLRAALPLPDLQLPANLPRQLSVLANRLTSGSASEYEQVERLMAYLKTHERYATTNVPVPTGSTDFVTQFLFDSHLGYCDQFSSALVVLLREVGVPARLTTGFTTGTRDAWYRGVGQRYVIRAQDAHAWAEVYFPGAGWVPFDPTPGFSVPTAPVRPVLNTNAGTIAAAGGVGYGQRPLQSSAVVSGAGQPGTPSPAEPSSGDGQKATSQPGNSIWVWRAILGVAAGVLLSLGYGVAWFWRHGRRSGRVVPCRSGTWDAQEPPVEGDIEPAERLRMAVNRLMSALRTSGQTIPKNLTLRDLRPYLERLGAAAGFNEAVRHVEQAWYGPEPLSPERLDETLWQLNQMTTYVDAMCRST